MLKIRLTRTGKKQEPHYKIVVCETRSKRDGKVIAQIGAWHPKQKDLKLDRSGFESWLTKGARPSQTVRNLYAKSS